MKEKDGRERIVEYYDKGHGFHAVVKYVGKPRHEKPKHGHGGSGEGGSS